jgi:MFS family permease
MGQSVSTAGSMMQSTALHWHLYHLTGDPLALGLIGVFRFIPIILFSMIGGAFADAHDRRRIMLTCQFVLLGIAATLSVLTATNHITPVAIYVLVTLSAAATAFDNPSRQSLFANLVPREHFPSAASLNSLSFRMATIIGPALAGVLIAAYGPKVAYGLNALSFISVIIALMRIRSPQRESAKEDRPEISLEALKDGLRFVRRTPIMISTMLVDFIATFFSSADTLLPVFAKDVLHVDEIGYGWLAASPAIGAMLVGGLLAMRPTLNRHGFALISSVAVYGFATIVFGLSQNFWLSMFALACTGGADTISTVVRQTVRQLVTPDHLRGRMVAINMVFFMGGPQLGEFEAGLVARWLGAPFSVVSGGIVCLLSVGLIVRGWPWLLHYQVDHRRPAEGTTSTESPVTEPDNSEPSKPN